MDDPIFPESNRQSDKYRICKERAFAVLDDTGLVGSVEVEIVQSHIQDI